MLPMLLPGGDNIYAGRVDIAVSQRICQLADILVDTVKAAGEQMPQIMGKHL